MTLETLETRQLMAYSAFGYSLPQLVVTGYGPPVAAYGGTLSVDIKVENRGASSLIEPTALYPGALSSADVLTTSVQVYASATPNAKGGYILLGTVTTPEIRQNQDYETVATLPLPTRRVGFPSGKFYLTLVANNDRSVIQANNSGNIYHIPKPVQIAANSLPDLQVIGFDIPRPLQPGDVVSPTIRIENFGDADSGLQGPVTVALVASLNKNFGVGDAAVASFTIPSLPGTSGVPTLSPTIPSTQNLFPLPNQFAITLPAFKLPTTPGFYYLGIKIDPGHAINQTYGPNSALSFPVPVGPVDRFLPPAAVLVPLGATAPVFPALPVTFVNTAGLGQVPLVTPINPNGPITALASATNGSVVTVSAQALKPHRSGRGK